MLQMAQKQNLVQECFNYQAPIYPQVTNEWNWIASPTWRNWFRNLFKLFSSINFVTFCCRNIGFVGVSPVAADVVLSPRTRRMPGSTPPPADQSEFGTHKPGSWKAQGPIKSGHLIAKGPADHRKLDEKSARWSHVHFTWQHCLRAVPSSGK